MSFSISRSNEYNDIYFVIQKVRIRFSDNNEATFVLVCIVPFYEKAILLEKKFILQNKSLLCNLIELLNKKIILYVFKILNVNLFFLYKYKTN